MILLIPESPRVLQCKFSRCARFSKLSVFKHVSSSLPSVAVRLLDSDTSHVVCAPHSPDIVQLDNPVNSLASSFSAVKTVNRCHINNTFNISQNGQRSNKIKETSQTFLLFLCSLDCESKQIN